MSYKGAYRDSQGRLRPVTSTRGRASGHTKSYPSAGIKHRGALTSHGYYLSDDNSVRRHEALERAVRQDGYKDTIDRLAALEGVNKGKPLHSRAKEDIDYLEEKHG